MRVQVERSDSGKRNRIYLRSPYDPAVVSRCKQIFGGSWSAAKKVWSYPLDYGTCIELRRQFGKSLVIGPELWAWAAAERERQDQLNALLDGAQGVCPRVEEQEPKLAAAFRSRPYQATGAQYLAMARHGLCGDDPGLGKTLETFGAIVEAGYTEGVFLVFCPSSAIRSTWEANLREWMPNDVAIPVTGTRKQREQAFAELQAMIDINAGSTPGARYRIWLICNIEMTRVQFTAKCPGHNRNDLALSDSGKPEDMPEPCDGEYVGCPYAKRHKQTAEPLYSKLFEHEFDAIVLDESHKAIAGTKSRKQKQSQQRVGFGMLQLAEDGMRIALSGTPWRGKPENFWGTLNWLRPDIYTGFWRYAEKYHDISYNGFGKKIGKIRPEMEDEWQRELRSVMIRRSKKDPGIADDLPPKAYAGTHLDGANGGLKGVWLEMLPKQATAYRKFALDAVLKLKGGALYGNGTLSQIGRLRQLATAPLRFDGQRTVKGEQEPIFSPEMPSNKFEWLCDFLAERGIMGDVCGDRKVIVSSNYTKTLNLFRAELLKKGVQSHILTGETKSRDRDRQVAEFQGSGGPRVFFLNTNAGGTSITLDAADDIVKIDRTWNPDDDTQVEDRIHRVSRIHQVTVYNLYSLGTIEEEIGRIADERDDIQKILLDGMRGVKFALKLLKEFE